MRIVAPTASGTSARDDKTACGRQPMASHQGLCWGQSLQQSQSGQFVGQSQASLSLQHGQFAVSLIVWFSYWCASRPGATRESSPLGGYLGFGQKALSLAAFQRGAKGEALACPSPKSQFGDLECLSRARSSEAFGSGSGEREGGHTRGADPCHVHQ